MHNAEDEFQQTKPSVVSRFGGWSDDDLLLPATIYISFAPVFAIMGESREQASE